MPQRRRRLFRSGWMLLTAAGALALCMPIATAKAQPQGIPDIGAIPDIGSRPGQNKPGNQPREVVTDRPEAPPSEVLEDGMPVLPDHLDKLLQDDRWEEAEFGLSIRPPKDAALLRRSSDDLMPPHIADALGTGTELRGQLTGLNAIRRHLQNDPEGARLLHSLQGQHRLVAEDAAFAVRRGEQPPQLRMASDKPNYVIDLAVRDNLDELDIKAIYAKALQQVTFYDRNAVVLEWEPTNVGKHPGVMVVFELNREGGQPWMMVQQLVRITQTHILLLRLKVDKNDYHSVRPIFDAVRQSLVVFNPFYLNAQREKLVAAGDAWLKTVDTQQIEQALQGEQWYHIIDDRQKVGYLKLSQSRVQAMGVPGLRLQVHARLYNTGKAVDTERILWVSDPQMLDAPPIDMPTLEGPKDPTNIRPGDAWQREPEGAQVALAGGEGQRQEVFWFLQTIREPGQDADAPTSTDLTWRLTGIMDKLKRPNSTLAFRVLKITEENPGDRGTYEYPQPKDGYLTQVEALLLGQLMKTAPNTTELGFYYFDPTSGNMTFRSDQRIANPDGSYTVISRTSPDQPFEVANYDTQGNLVRRIMASGRVLERTTQAQIQQVWQTRERLFK